MTPGVTPETVDGMSLEKINTLIEALRNERYRWTPVRRIYIPKKNHKLRPLGLPTWSDKLLQEVIRSLLEAYYEPQFSESSHDSDPAEDVTLPYEMSSKKVEVQSGLSKEISAPVSIGHLDTPMKNATS